MEILMKNKKATVMKNSITNSVLGESNDFNANVYLVVHPIFDVPEEKVDVENALPMKINNSVKWSLITLRGYLVVMIGLAFYRTLVLAGVL